MSKYFWIIFVLMGLWQFIGSIAERATKKQQDQRVSDLTAQRRRQQMAARRATTGNDAPAPAVNAVPSTSISSRTRRKRSTRPRTPASRTSRLDPLPSTRQGTPSAPAQRTASSRSARSAGVASNSAAPPTRHVVNGARDASLSMRPRNPACSSRFARLTLSGSHIVAECNRSARRDGHFERRDRKARRRRLDRCA